MTSSADPNCDVAQPHSKISTGNVIQQVNQRESTENNGIADQDLGKKFGSPQIMVSTVSTTLEMRVLNFKSWECKNDCI